MVMLRSCLGATSRWLGRHLGRLNRALSSLGDRLREAVSAVGSSVDGAIREAVHGLLDGLASPPPLRPPRRGAPSAQAPLWDRSDEYGAPPERPYGEPWQDEPYEPSHRDWEEREPAVEPEPAPRPCRWPAALAAGLQAAAWWLRRAARPTLLTATGVGLLAALTAWAWGPLALAGLAGSALALAALPYEPDGTWSGVETSPR
jgi:hypothetical protein